MKLWTAQQILCRYDPEAVIHVKLPEGRTVALDHIEDHYPRSDEECTCLDDEDLDPRCHEDPHFDPVDSECGKHGDESYRMPLFVTGDSHSPEVFHQAEEAECAHMVLDDMGIPREEANPREEGEMYSLVGRITVALERVRGKPIEYNYEYETTTKKCEDVGVDKAMIPTPPEGAGWELACTSFGANAFWFFWRRPKGR